MRSTTLTGALFLGILSLLSTAANGQCSQTGGSGTPITIQFRTSPTNGFSTIAQFRTDANFGPCRPSNASQIEITYSEASGKLLINDLGGITNDDGFRIFGSRTTSHLGLIEFSGSGGDNDIDLIIANGVILVDDSPATQGVPGLASWSGGLDQGAKTIRLHAHVSGEISGDVVASATRHVRAHTISGRIFGGNAPSNPDILSVVAEQFIGAVVQTRNGDINRIAQEDIDGDGIISNPMELDVRILEEGSITNRVRAEAGFIGSIVTPCDTASSGKKNNSIDIVEVIEGDFVGSIICGGTLNAINISDGDFVGAIYSRLRIGSLDVPNGSIYGLGQQPLLVISSNCIEVGDDLCDYLTDPTRVGQQGGMAGEIIPATVCTERQISMSTFGVSGHPDIDASVYWNAIVESINASQSSMPGIMMQGDYGVSPAGGRDPGSLVVQGGITSSVPISIGGSFYGKIESRSSQASGPIGLQGPIVINSGNAGGGWFGDVVVATDGIVQTLSGPDYEDNQASGVLGRVGADGLAQGSVGLVPYRLWRADSAPVDGSIVASVADDVAVTARDSIVVSFQGNIEFEDGTVLDGPSAVDATLLPMRVVRTALSAQGVDIGVAPLDISDQLVFAIASDGNRLEVSPLSAFDVDGNYEFFLNERILCDTGIPASEVPIADLFGASVSDYGFTVGADGCNDADIATPGGILDIDDVDMFIQAFTFGAVAADLVSPFGIVDIDDVDAFITTFLAGCPGGEGGDPGLIDDAFGAGSQSVSMGSGVAEVPCNGGDLAEPFGQLDANDIIAFADAYATCGPVIAGLGGSSASCDEADVLAFANLFVTGCGH